MRRSRLVFTLSLGISVAVALAPASGVGPGGWDSVGTGSTASKPSLNGKVLALNTDRTGSVYAGGAFTNAGGVAAADRIARWDGTKWKAIGGTPLTNSLAAEVRAIAYDPATGKVYAGGTFQDAGGNAAADFLAVWDGSSWQPACTSPSRPAFTGNVDALQIVGSTLYVGGEFQDGGEITTADYLLACDLATGASFSILPIDGASPDPSTPWPPTARGRSTPAATSATWRRCRPPTTWPPTGPASGRPWEPAPDRPAGPSAASSAA